MLVRNTALTHVVDGDQRSVVLPFTGPREHDHGHVPATPTSCRPGPYMLFVDQATAEGLIPSVGHQVFVGPQAPPVPLNH